MELITVALIATALLMTAELGDFVQRRRGHSITEDSAPSGTSVRSAVRKPAAARHEDVYDVAA